MYLTLSPGSYNSPLVIIINSIIFIIIQPIRVDAALPRDDRSSPVSRDCRRAPSRRWPARLEFLSFDHRRRGHSSRMPRGRVRNNEAGRWKNLRARNRSQERARRKLLVLDSVPALHMPGNYAFSFVSKAKVIRRGETSQGERLEPQARAAPFSRSCSFASSSLSSSSTVEGSRDVELIRRELCGIEERKFTSCPSITRAHAHAHRRGPTGGFSPGLFLILALAARASKEAASGCIAAMMDRTVRGQPSRERSEPRYPDDPHRLGRNPTFCRSHLEKLNGQLA